MMEEEILTHRTFKRKKSNVLFPKNSLASKIILKEFFGRY